MLHVECMHGHVVDEKTDKCSAGHVSLFRSVKCPIASCGFLSESRYAHVDIPLDRSYNEVKKHFKSDHGYELDSNDLGEEVDREQKEGTDVVEKDDLSIEDETPKETNEPRKKVAPAESVDFNGNSEAENDLSCPKCFKIMRTKFTLRRHICQVHENKQKFKCSYCDRSFCAKFSLTYHIKKVHLTVGNDFNCEKCGEIFLDFKAYRAHRAEHRVSQEKLILKCQYCGLDIKRTSMNKHVTEVHKKEIRYDNKKVVCLVYPHKCNQCECAFKRKYDLHRHQKAKHENRVYRCPVCSKNFKYLTNMKRHVKTEHDAGKDNGGDNDHDAFDDDDDCHDAFDDNGHEAGPSALL